MKHQNQNQRCWCSFLSRKLLAVLISVALLAAMLTGSVTGAYALLNLQYRCTWAGEWTACRLRRRPPAGVLIQLLFFQTMASPKSEH
ncbi:hypothetical protein ZEAMMB73_Zm00001d040097, partial [Zea mays]